MIHALRVLSVVALASTLTADYIASPLTRTAPVHASARVRPTPGPQSFTDVVTASRADLLRYARSLSFDTSYHATDSRRLLEHSATGEPALGPLAVLAPEIGITAMSFAQMDSGRIVARILVDGPAESYGFAKGENYIWVNRTNAGRRAIVIPADSNVPLRQFSYEIQHRQVNPPEASPQARFRWNDLRSMEYIWISCDVGCCLIDSGRGRPAPRPPV